MQHLFSYKSHKSHPTISNLVYTISMNLLPEAFIPMNKELADEFISQYQTKIFGFAMEKMRNITQAEELASDIVCEVYLAFLRADEIANPDGYVYRIARNIHARYIHRLTHERDFADISDVLLPYHERGFDRLEQQETIDLLRKEIAFLSERQRTII